MIIDGHDTTNATRWTQANDPRAPPATRPPRRLALAILIGSVLLATAAAPTMATHGTYTVDYVGFGGTETAGVLAGGNQPCADHGSPPLCAKLQLGAGQAVVATINDYVFGHHGPITLCLDGDGNGLCDRNDPNDSVTGNACGINGIYNSFPHAADLWVFVMEPVQQDCAALGSFTTFGTVVIAVYT